MFDGLKLRWFIAAVQAELKAQYDNQAFVNLICLNPANVERLADLNLNAYFRKTKIAPFMAACHVLETSLSLADIPFEQRLVCAKLLGQRLDKVRANPAFRLQHLMIFGNLEEKLLGWLASNQKDQI